MTSPRKTEADQAWLWQGDPARLAIESMGFPEAMTHVTVHRATRGEYQFLHGAAIVFHQNVLFAGWANSPVDENSADEIFRGRRSSDGGYTWSEVEIIGPGFEGQERHSHGTFLSDQGTLWAFGARFGIGAGGMFPGLQTEAFMLDERSDKWQSRGLAARDGWPVDNPKRMADGNWIMGGIDRNFRAVVMLGRGDDLTHWDVVRIPQRADQFYSETTVLVEDGELTAIMRNQTEAQVAGMATSADCGRTWSTARESDYPMGESKPFAGVLSTRQRYLVSNPPRNGRYNRDVLTIAVSRPDAKFFSQVWKIRHDGSPPRFPGMGKGWGGFPEWSYPYAIERDGRLYIVYSVGKEDCELSIIPLRALTVSHD